MKKWTLRFRAEDKDGFANIRTGKKTIETRAGTSRYRKIKKGDILTFICAKDRFERNIKDVRHFSSIDAMLKTFPLKKIMPDVSSAEEMKHIYYSFPKYKEKIRDYGLLAFVLSESIKSFQKVKNTPLRNRVKPWKKKLAIRMRNNQTPSEELLWELIRAKKLGYGFRRQSVILGWIADFYCPSKRFVVELDGKFHNAQKDRTRDDVFKKHNVATLRIKSRRIYSNPSAVVQEIKTTLESLPDVRKRRKIIVVNNGVG